jgi:hypothetical protein
MTITHPASATRTGTAPRVPLRTLATPLVAVTVATAVWGLARALGVDLVVGSGAGRQVVGIAGVVIVALLATLLGAAAHRVLRRVTGRAFAWPLLAGSVLLVSLAGPAGAATPAAGLLLAAMHVGVGLTVILGQPRTTAGRR